MYIIPKFWSTREGDKLTKIYLFNLFASIKSPQLNTVCRYSTNGKEKLRIAFLSIIICLIFYLPISSFVKSRVRGAYAWAGFASLTVLLHRSGMSISYSCRIRIARGDSASSYSCNYVRSTCKERAS